ncbi:MAG: hypothetical protein IPI53_17190 [Saprospiraceae bacterium]|nr:hypothetical protein [Saprospiraceae bacterium]
MITSLEITPTFDSVTSIAPETTSTKFAPFRFIVYWNPKISLKLAAVTATSNVSPASTLLSAAVKSSLEAVLLSDCALITSVDALPFTSPILTATKSCPSTSFVLTSKLITSL